MNATALRAALRALNVNQAWLARRLRVSPNQVSRWAVGAVPVPGYAEEYLRLARGIHDLVRGIDL